MNKTLLITLISIAIAGSAAAESPKGREQTKSKPAKQNYGRLLQSHSKQVGNIGPFQVHSLRIRGLDSPNVSAAIIYDPRSETYTVVGPATGAGLGSAILGAAGNVGSSAVFGMSLRPTRINESISNNSQSEGSSAEGGDASSVSKSAGGTAVSVSNADADASVKNSNSVRNSNTNANSNNNRVDRVSSPKKSRKSKKSKH